MTATSELSTSLDAALRKQFPKLKEDAYIAAAEICNEKILTAGDLFCKWEAHAMSSRRGPDPPTAAELRKLALTIEIHTKKVNVPRHEAQPIMFHNPAPEALRMTMEGLANFTGEELTGVLDEPIIGDTKMGGSPDRERKHRVKTEARALPGTAPKPPLRDAPSGEKREEIKIEKRVEFVLNKERKRLRTKSAARVEQLGVSLHKNYVTDNRLSYMNDDLRGRVDIVRTHLQQLSEHVIERARTFLVDGAELPPMNPDAFNKPSSDTVMAVGRVRVDLDESEGTGVGRINEKSVELESENGSLLKLDLSRLRVHKKQLFLHPGMVIAVEGVNTNGRIMEVSEVYDNAIPVSNDVPLAGRAAEPAKKEEDIVYPMNGTNPETDEDEDYVHIIAAGGPYTISMDLKYDPLLKLKKVIAHSKPDVVLLTGPFVDDAHPEVNERLSITFDKLFEEKVLARVRELAEEEYETHFVLIPALGDAHHDFVAPQPALSVPYKLPPNIMLAPNPAVLRVGTSQASLNIGLSSLPAIQDISADSLIWNKGDRFSAIASHMLRQGSFYPTNPPAAGVPLDFTLLNRVAMPVGPDTPGVDLLVLPSKLKAFAKVADFDTVVVNPGILARGNTGGTYAEITLPLREEKDDIPKKAIVGTVESSKCQAEIIRV